MEASWDQIALDQTEVVAIAVVLLAFDDWGLKLCLDLGFKWLNIEPKKFAILFLHIAQSIKNPWNQKEGVKHMHLAKNNLLPEENCIYGKSKGPLKHLGHNFQSI